MSANAVKRTAFFGAVLAGALAFDATAQQPIITDMLRQTNGFELQWTSPTNRNILAAAPAASEPYEFITPVLDGYEGVVTNNLPIHFYRVRQVVVVNIADTNIELGIWNALVGKVEPVDELYDFEAATVTNLSPAAILIGKDVTDLSGLEYTSIVSLNLSLCTNLSDITPLAGLTTLTRLDFLDNQIADLTPLAGLTNLTSLEFPANLVSDLGPLGNLVKLTRLSMFDNQITDIGPLAGLTNLVQLIASQNQISDVSPLAGLVKLEDLRLDNNLVTNISPLTALSQLQLLRLTNNLITDIGALVTNSLNGGLGTGDVVRLQGNPLSSFALTNDIPFLTNQGVTVFFDP